MSRYNVLDTGRSLLFRFETSPQPVHPFVIIESENVRRALCEWRILENQVYPIPGAVGKSAFMEK
jgi:hypothetical protein